MTVATVPTRPRTSDEFLAHNTRNRVLAGTAKAIAKGGYCGTSIADIVKATCCSRNTFYYAFGSKEVAARALVAEMGLADELGKRAALDVLLIEIAASAKAQATDPTARELALGAAQIFRFLADCYLNAPPCSEDALQQKLPPGRHGLSREFTTENQRTRLLTGLAVVVGRYGLQATTIQAVCEQASISRRTFYELFASLDNAAQAMLDALIKTTVLDEVDPGCGLFAVAIEIVAERTVEGASPLAAQAVTAMQKVAKAVGG